VLARRDELSPVASDAGIGVRCAGGLRRVERFESEVIDYRVGWRIGKKAWRRLAECSASTCDSRDGCRCFHKVTTIRGHH
jgi:hypothetical protein